MDLSIKNGGSFHSYVSLPEGTMNYQHLGEVPKLWSIPQLGFSSESLMNPAYSNSAEAWHFAQSQCPSQAPLVTNPCHSSDTWHAMDWSAMDSIHSMCATCKKDSWPWTEWIFSSKDISLHSTTFHYPFGGGWLHRGNMWVPFTWPLATPSPNQTPSYFSGACNSCCFFLLFFIPSMFTLDYPLVI